MDTHLRYHCDFVKSIRNFGLGFIPETPTKLINKKEIRYAFDLKKPKIDLHNVPSKPVHAPHSIQAVYLATYHDS